MSRWPPRPSLTPHFYKAHGLGNDYLVFEEGEGWLATSANVHRVCDRHVGVGSDGIVVLLKGSGPGPGPDAPHRAMLRMFNPDGSEFERSGNGLRVLASFVATRFPETRAIEASVGGERVRMTLHGREGPRHDVSVEMGQARTGAGAVEMDPAALADGRLRSPAGEELDVVPVSIGNPHLVVVDEGEGVTEERLAAIGPYLATHPSLASGANVQLAAAVGASECRALIWERGVGRTSASGTSACAVAVAMVASERLAPGELTVHMPGGNLGVRVGSDLDVVLRGPVEEVLEGALRPALLAGSLSE